MKIRKLCINIKKRIVDLEPTSKHSMLLIVILYKTVLMIFGRYNGRKKSAYKVILDNVEDSQNLTNRQIRKIFNEILYCRFMYGIAAKEYFIYEFEKLSHEGRKTFITRGNKYSYYKKANNQSYINYFNVKTETFHKFSEFYGRDVLCLYDNSDLYGFKKFVEKHPMFIYKPAVDYGGKGIKIFDVSLFRTVEELFMIIMCNGTCVVEEIIIQASPLLDVHPESVNTMRVVAYLNNDNVEIKWCFLRMGMGESFTDNMSSGGLSVMVDPETGIACGTGKDWKGTEHIFHPDTGVQLVGMRIPEWDELLRLIDELARVIPQVRIVGWDLAYTDKGWIFVEGNAKPQCVSAQITKFNGKKYLLENVI